MLHPPRAFPAADGFSPRLMFTAGCGQHVTSIWIWKQAGRASAGVWGKERALGDLIPVPGRVPVSGSSGDGQCLAPACLQTPG